MNITMFENTNIPMNNKINEIISMNNETLSMNNETLSVKNEINKTVSVKNKINKNVPIKNKVNKAIYRKNKANKNILTKDKIDKSTSTKNKTNEYNSINNKSSSKTNKSNTNFNTTDYIAIQNNIISYKYYVLGCLNYSRSILPEYISSNYLPYLNETRRELLQSVIDNLNENKKAIAAYYLDRFMKLLTKTKIHRISTTKLLYLLKYSAEILPRKKYLEIMKRTYKTDKDVMMDNIHKSKKELILALEKNDNLKYNFGYNYSGTNKHNEDIVEHLLLHKNHIFKDIGNKDTEEKNVVYRIGCGIPYYDEIHELVKLVYDKNTNTISEEYKKQIYDIINYSIINPVINDFIDRLNNDYMMLDYYPITVSTNGYTCNHGIGLAVTNTMCCNLTNYPRRRLSLALQYDVKENAINGYITSFYTLSEDGTNKQLNIFKLIPDIFKFIPNI